MIVGQHSFKHLFFAVAYIVATSQQSGAVNKERILMRGLAQSCEEDLLALHNDTELGSIATALSESFEKECDLNGLFAGNSSDALFATNSSVVCSTDFDEDTKTISVTIDICSLEIQDFKDTCIAKGGQYCSYNVFVKAVATSSQSQLTKTCKSVCIPTSCSPEDFSEEDEKQLAMVFIDGEVNTDNIDVKTWGECIDSNGQSNRFGTPISP